MSRTKRRGGSTSPVQKYLTFSGQTGVFSYYDKELGNNVELDKLEIIVLDIRSSIGGWSEKIGAQIRSNYVVSTAKEPFKVYTLTNKNVRTSHELANGLYKDIKDTIKAENGKFTANLFCLVNFDGEWEMCNLQLSGVSLGCWFDFQTEHTNDEFYDYVITLEKGPLSKRGKKGNVDVTEKEEKELTAKLKKNPRIKQPVWYYTLSMSVDELSEEESELAIAEDERLQLYFDDVKDSTPESSDSGNDKQKDLEPIEEEEEVGDDLPF